MASLKSLERSNRNGEHFGMKMDDMPPISSAKQKLAH